MKILVVGDWHSKIHEEAVYQALKQLNHNVLGFPWSPYFKYSSSILSFPDRLIKKFQNKYLFGPLVTRLNQQLLDTVAKEKPDAVFIYRGTHILAGVLNKIKEMLPNTILIGYNNDDPFAKGYSFWFWRHFIKAIPKYDIVLAYRHHNLAELEKAGAKQTALLRSWYIPKQNHPVILSDKEQEKYACDVVFIGHYEADGRLEKLEQIVQKGFKLKLFGPGFTWNKALKNSNILNGFAPIELVWGEEYNKALCGAKVALCFLSKLNRDTYTRRCFEIPATGTLMLSEHSNDLAGLYQEGVEADFFSSTDELIQKLHKYMEPTLRKKVASAGLQCVKRDGHDVVSRMRYVVKLVEELLAAKGK